MSTSAISERPEVATSARDVVGALVKRARAAQRSYDSWTQEQVDDVVTAVGWGHRQPPAQSRARRV